MQYDRKIGFLLMLLVSAACLFAAELQLPEPDRQREVNSILASVNGEPISLFDVLPRTREQETLALALYPVEELPRRIMELRRQAVDELIDRKLIVADYRQQTFRVPPQEIDREMDKIADRLGCRSRSDFVRKLQENNSDVEQLRREIEEYYAVELMLHRAQQTGRQPTPAELHAYYEENRDRFTSPDEIELALIQLKTDDAELTETLAAQLAASPDDFAVLADRHSIAAAAGAGGKLGRLEFSRLRPEFRAALDPIEPMKVYGPISGADGRFFLRVLAFHPGAGSSFQSALPRLREELNTRFRAESLREYRQRLREQAVIRYFINATDTEHKTQL